MTTYYPWGTTGRVTIDGDVGDPRALPNIHVDGEWVGWLYTPDDGHPKWGARTGVGQAGERDDLPSLDAAVRWVLRRAAADVWRQERGPVWRVESDLLWSPDELVPGWFATRPDRTAGIGWPNWADALACAHNNARAATTS